eukprot:TRINITY_DN241_c0_g2_i1.p1 TRINITY_DN241_c0_g2~~TRINITY_DN241_c0_g2_i1.p1  ORF type:complete len:331 (+),score=88.82 TRINITY_DN241_c0_g2_i1:182-1174(+)
MGPHSLERPENERWGWKQHIELEEEIPQVVMDPPMVPQIAKDAYEKWKVENIDEVAKHAGRYAVVRWDLKTNTGGIAMSYDPKEMQATNIEYTSQQWVDYIQPAYGTVDIQEDLTKWNTTNFEDFEGLKEWCTFDDRASWSKAPATTPVSARITNKADPATLKEPIERPGIAKWLTFTSWYGYGSEQFAPAFASVSPLGQEICKVQRYIPRVIHNATTGLARDYIPDTMFTRSPCAKRGSKRFAWYSQVDRRVAAVHKVDPSGKEVWLGPRNMMLSALNRRVEKRAGRKHLWNLVSASSYSVNHYYINHPRYQHHNFYSAIGSYRSYLKK